MARAYYEPTDDMLVVDFGDGDLDVSENSQQPEERWSMFTHGVLAPVVNNTYEFHKIGIRGQDLGGDDIKNWIAELLERAADRIAYMAENAATRLGFSLKGCEPEACNFPQFQQLRHAAEILETECSRLVEELYAAYETRERLRGET